MPAIKNIAGQKFGRLTALRCVGRNKSRNALWRVECSCAAKTRKVVASEDLIRKHTKSCGCLSARDLTGQTFGRLTVIRRAGRNKQRNAIWLCRCSCAARTQKVVSTQTLTRHCTKSCGCLRFKHGHSRGHRTPTYSVWHGVVQRCANPNTPGWKYYGGAGVEVDSRWLGEHGFEMFLSDMHERSEGTTLGRYLDSGNYSPENCAWQTSAEQAAEAKGKRAMLALRTYHQTQAVAA